MMRDAGESGRLMQDALRAVREELDAHLEDINENTSEISAAHDALGELEMRLEKLAERVDALQALMLAQTSGPVARTRSVRLSPKERDVLQALLSDEGTPTSAEIGKRIGLTSDVVAQTLYCMARKGIPVLAQTARDEVCYALEAGFRKTQQERHLDVTF